MIMFILPEEDGELESDEDTDGKNFGNKGFVCGIPDRGRYGESRQPPQLYASQRRKAGNRRGKRQRKECFLAGCYAADCHPSGQITGGSILYKGRDLVQASEKEMQKIRGNEISMIFQEPMTSLNPIIKCGKQIAESLRLHRGLDKKEAMEEAVRIMHAVGIANPQVRAYEYPIRCPEVCVEDHDRHGSGLRSADSDCR